MKFRADHFEIVKNDVIVFLKFLRVIELHYIFPLAKILFVLQEYACLLV